MNIECRRVFHEDDGINSIKSFGIVNEDRVYEMSFYAISVAEN